MVEPAQSQDGKATGRDTDVMAGFAKGLGVIEGLIDQLEQA